MTDAHIALMDMFEKLEKAQYVCLLKYDGQRSHLRRTIVVSGKESEHSFRLDFDDMASALNELNIWVRQYAGGLIK